MKKEREIKKAEKRVTRRILYSWILVMCTILSWSTNIDIVSAHESKVIDVASSDEYGYINGTDGKPKIKAYGEITKGIVESRKTIRIPYSETFDSVKTKIIYLHPNERITFSVGKKYKDVKVRWSTSTPELISFSAKEGYRIKVTAKKIGKAKGSVTVGEKKYNFTIDISKLKLLKKKVTLTSRSANKNDPVLFCAEWKKLGKDTDEDTSCYAYTYEDYEFETEYYSFFGEGEIQEVGVSKSNKTGYAYLYPKGYGYHDVLLTIITMNRCEHQYLIKTYYPPSQNAKVAMDSLKNWQNKNKTSLTDQEILDRVQKFIDSEGNQELESNRRDFVNELVNYVWNPRVASVNLKNPKKVISKRYDVVKRMDVKKNILEEIVNYPSIEQMTEKQLQFDGFKCTRPVLSCTMKWYINDLDAIQIGDVICEDFGTYFRGYYFVVGFYTDTWDDGEEKWLVVANPDPEIYDPNGNYLNILSESELECNGFSVISFR